MKTINVDLSSGEALNLLVGRQGESGVTQVVFDFSALKTEFGTGTVSLSVKRPKEPTPYAQTITTDGTDATWLVNETDTGVAGCGEIQLTYTVNSQIAKTVVFKYTVYPSIGVDGEYPIPGQAWQQEIEEDISEIREDLSSLPFADVNSTSSMTNTSKLYRCSGALYFYNGTEWTEVGTGNVSEVTGMETASSVAAMTDTSKIYLYTGSETGYVCGNWYYYNGSSWVSGGAYGEYTLPDNLVYYRPDSSDDSGDDTPTSIGVLTIKDSNATTLGTYDTSEDVTITLPSSGGGGGSSSGGECVFLGKTEITYTEDTPFSLDVTCSEDVTDNDGIFLFKKIGIGFKYPICSAASQCNFIIGKTQICSGMSTATSGTQIVRYAEFEPLCDMGSGMVYKVTAAQSSGPSIPIFNATSQAGFPSAGAANQANASKIGKYANINASRSNNVVRIAPWTSLNAISGETAFLYVWGVR